MNGKIMQALTYISLLVYLLFNTGCTTPAGGRWPAKGVVSPRDAKSPAQVIQIDDMELELLSDHKQYFVGEPVYLTARLKNAGPETQKIISSLDPIDGALEIRLTDPTQQVRTFNPLGEADLDESTLTNLLPGGVVGNVFPVFFGGQGWTFPTPGRYVLVAVYRFPFGSGKVATVRSAALDIDIQSSPQGEGEFLIGEDLKVSRETGKFMAWQGGDHLEAGQALLQTLLQRWPDSPLADYIHSAYTRSFGKRFMDYRKRQVRPPDCRMALEHLAKVKGGRLPDFLRFQNAVIEARCAMREQDLFGARERLNRAKAIASDRPEYSGMLARVREMEHLMPGRKQ